MSDFIFKLRKGFTRYLSKESRSRSHAYLKRALHIFLKLLSGTVENFIAKKGFEKASTMTFYTLLSIVPLVAIGFGVAQYLGFEEQFANLIRQEFYHQPQIAEKMIQFSLSTLKQTRGDIIASIGMVVLLWTVVRMFGNIESYFNEFWHVNQSRSLWQQIVNFIPLILIFPLFLVGSSSLIIFLSTTSHSLLNMMGFSQFVDGIILYVFKIVHFLLNWCWLSFLFIFLPNTKVSWKAGIIAGLVSGLFFIGWQWIYVTFQVNAASYGAIYGSFAAIPLFLFWLNYSWLILLLGSELSYQIQLRQKKIKSSF